ncbi:putative protein kinase [Tieghemostelium lacteum]|uniref:Protein kinase domain-containing protein n=1 Tax=Tieghemostelium lacteum TaxID=361077 RepID=A0A152A3Z3_TIELA|nr:putative protein kinase [Tieghemostelium lacteum]|eukprot:KYR00936.1 putative protein kinase [Tieghemostelium lacteum]
MSYIFKNENYRIFNPSIQWILSEKVNYDKLLITIPEIYIPPSIPTIIPPVPTIENNNNSNSNNNIQSITNSNSYSQVILPTVNNNFKFMVSGSIRIFSDSLSPNIVATILNEYNESRLNNIKLLFDLLLKLETYFIKKNESQFELFKYILEDYKVIGGSSQVNGSGNGNHITQLEIFTQLQDILEVHTSIHSKLKAILETIPLSNSQQQEQQKLELLNTFKLVYWEFIFILNSRFKQWKLAYSSQNRYLILMNETIHEKIIALKFFYHSCAHLWVFIDLIDEIYKSLYANDKNKSAAIINFGETALKKLKEIKSTNQSKLTGNYILRFGSGVGDQKGKYPKFKFTNDKLLIHMNSLTKMTFNYGDFSIRFKYQFNGVSLSTLDNSDEVPTKQSLLENIKNNNELLFYSKNLRFSFQSSEIPCQEILNVLDCILQCKDINQRQCSICKFHCCWSIKPCDNCKQLVCGICSISMSPTDQVDVTCLNCCLLTPVNINAKYFDHLLTVPINSSDFRVFCTTIYKEFNLPKGSLFRFSFTEKPLIFIENIYTLMQVHKELHEMKKPILLNIQMKDPAVGVPTIPKSALTFLTSEVRDGNKGGHGSISRIQVDKRYLNVDQPLVIKKLKLAIVSMKSDSLENDERIEFNNQAMERFQYEAFYISQLCKRSKYVIRIYGFCDDPLGFILEEAPLGSLSRRSFGSWELILLILIDICKGMRDIHAYGLIHRDLKPDNILLFSESLNYEDIRCKIADFGISTPIRKPHDLNHTGVQRTPYYTAPEFNKYGTYTELVDVFTFGLILFNMLTGKKYLNNFGNIAEKLDDYKWFPKEIKDLIESTTQINPTLRPPSFEVILNELNLLYHSKHYQKQQWQLQIPNNFS